MVLITGKRKMENLDDSENNAKISDSAYSNSCSNSHSRRSHSSKSTRSGSNSSRSSGYGGKAGSGYGSQMSTLTSQPPAKRSKGTRPKKKKSAPLVTLTTIGKPQTSESECPQHFCGKNEVKDYAQSTAATHTPSEIETEEMDTSFSDKKTVKDEDAPTGPCNNSTASNVSIKHNNCANINTEGFSCVISMDHGVVMYATASLKSSLGYPKDMWVGRSFIDFVHERDRDSLASFITNGLVNPSENGTQKKANATDPSPPKIVCRIRKYRGLNCGFGIKECKVTFTPFMLKLSFKDISDKEAPGTYLVIKATPIFPAFKYPNEILKKSSPFVIRHAANGNLVNLDPESVPYLGYLPQDVVNHDALMLYHPEDLPYLRNVYEDIVRDGSTSRCVAYRMLAQNGDFIKVETEWSSFINPWSKKLEFVTGKCYVVEGPFNPDVFEEPTADKSLNLPEDKKKLAQAYRENILCIMTEVLTQPAEMAKQEITKRCQDLASLMENLIEEQPKMDEELRLEQPDADYNYNERDSVMLGGISPHHEYDDGQSSTETPLSYTQLNYNENLNRYFENLVMPFGDDVDVAATDKAEILKDSNPSTSYGKSTAWIDLDESANKTNVNENDMNMYENELDTYGDYQNFKITESLLHKHNTEMEKELSKKNRELRLNTKTDREKLSKDKWYKKIEHLARCSGSFSQVAQTELTIEPEPLAQTRGVKRASKQAESENSKHHCSAFKLLRKSQLSRASGVPNAVPCSTPIQEQKPLRAQNAASSMNTFIFGVEIPQPMQMLTPMSTIPGVFPMYYASSHSEATMPNPPNNTPTDTNKVNQAYAHAPPMQCILYGSALYGSPFMYSAYAPPPVTYNVQQNVTASSLQTSSPLGLASSNYEEACKPSISMKPNKQSGNFWDNQRGSGAQSSCSRIEPKLLKNALDRVYNTQYRSVHRNYCHHKSSLYDYTLKSTEAVPDTSEERLTNSLRHSSENPSDDAAYKTDESSFSSFYSSFFKTDSSSADDSSDAKKSKDSRVRYFNSNAMKKTAKRKMDPPWLEQVCVTPNLLYNYQIANKTMDEVLLGDKEKMNALEQSDLVNEQLEQLYIGLQSQGILARLSLDEGITSSSSSGEETAEKATKSTRLRKKREFSKLAMIYEEDAPLPPPPGPEEPEPSTSKT